MYHGYFDTHPSQKTFQPLKKEQKKKPKKERLKPVENVFFHINYPYVSMFLIVHDCINMSLQFNCSDTLRFRFKKMMNRENQHIKNSKIEIKQYHKNRIE